MKKFILFIIMMLSISLTTNAQNYVRSGNTFTAKSCTKTKSSTKSVKTKFTWKDSKGKTYAIQVSSSGATFVIKTSSKTGKEYKNYLGPEISKEVCRELGIKYSSKK